jgi:hypothetical protein
MKKFLKKSFHLFIKFTFLIFLILLIKIYIFHHYQTNWSNVNTDVLAIGDSHIETAINPEDFKSLSNYGKSSETYFYTYLILKEVLKNNQTPNTIVLGVAPHNFQNKYDLYISGSIKRFYYIMSWEDWMLYFDTTFSGLNVRSLKNILAIRNILPSFTFNKMIKDDVFIFDSHFAGYHKSKNTNLEKEHSDSRIKNHFCETGENCVSGIQLEYFNKILEFLSSKQKKIILLNTPLHKMYRNEIPEKTISEYNKLTENTLMKNPNIVYYDYSTLLLPDSFYGDVDHVNFYGSKVVDSLLLSDGL